MRELWRRLAPWEPLNLNLNLVWSVLVECAAGWHRDRGWGMVSSEVDFADDGVEVTGTRGLHRIF